MDFDNENGMTWKTWQEMDCNLAEGTSYDISPWTEVTTNQEDTSYMIEDTTPIKACVDVSCKVSDNDNLMKDSDECKSSQAKRRRMLQFSNEAIDFSLCTEDLSTSYLKSKAREESVQGLSPEISPWDNMFSEIMPPSDFDMTEQDDWIAGFLNDPDVNPEEMSFWEDSDISFNISGSHNIIDVQPNHGAPLVEYCPPPDPAPVPKLAPKRATGKVIFKGRKSLIQTPMKLASSVAYPFSFIKPCPAKGGMTLNDINQKILAPPPPKNPDPTPSNLPKSAFSGKLVVGKTRIRTEGGKGSITIMRTRG